MKYNSNQILEILPHRQPFVLIDGILESEAGKSAIGLKNISLSDPVFQGHFPAEHIYPGVLQLEAMAQVGAIALLEIPENNGKIVLFAGVKNAKFKRQVKPGDTLIIETELSEVKMGIGIAKAKITINDAIASTATLMFSIN
ncbi:MAG: 3-hydroxyacyl-[acyl-carrier-protein] dehydratase FabZ [Clostridiales bacterium]|nr:MAG: 3-hydroxyacyl-[acyl-carrier-protein] dehydratase FabZ [Clostridiales bacterium]